MAPVIYSALCILFVFITSVCGQLLPQSVIEDCSVAFNAQEYNPMYEGGQVVLLLSCTDEGLSLVFETNITVPPEDQSRTVVYYQCWDPLGNVTSGSFDGFVSVWTTAARSVQLPAAYTAPGTVCEVYGCFQWSYEVISYFPINNGSCVQPAPVVTESPTTVPTTVPATVPATVTVAATVPTTNTDPVYNHCPQPDRDFLPSTNETFVRILDTTDCEGDTVHYSYSPGLPTSVIITLEYVCTDEQGQQVHESKVGSSRIDSDGVLDATDKYNSTVVGTYCFIRGCYYDHNMESTYSDVTPFTCSAPDPTTQRPDPTTQRPDPTTQRPDSTNQMPDPTTPTPDPTIKMPNSTTQRPDPTIKMPISNQMISEPERAIVILVSVSVFVLLVALTGFCIPLGIMLRLKQTQRRKYDIMRQGHMIKYSQSFDPEFCPPSFDFSAPIKPALSQASLFDTLSPYMAPGQSDDDKSVILGNSKPNTELSSMNSVVIDNKSNSDLLTQQDGHMTDEMEEMMSQNADPAPQSNNVSQPIDSQYPQNGYLPNSPPTVSSGYLPNSPPTVSSGYVVEQALHKSAPPTNSDYIRQEDLKIKKPVNLNWNIPRGLKSQQSNTDDGSSSGYFTDLTTPTEYSMVTLEHPPKIQLPQEELPEVTSPCSGLSQCSDQLYSESVIAECALSLSLNPSHFEPVKYEDIEPAVPSYMNTDQPMDSFYQSTLS